MNKNVIIAIVAVLVVAAVVFFLFGNNVKTSLNSKNPAQKPSPTSTTGNRHTAVSEITVVGTDFAFSPSTIVAKSGKKLTITFQNKGKAPHNLTIDKVGASKTLQAGQSETITINSPKAGTYSIECTVGNHKEKGMVGLLMVQ